MDEDTTKLKQLIESSERILITSHISPDPDAVSSVLLMGTTLEKNFPNKNIYMFLEEEPVGLGFLEDYESLNFKPVHMAIKELQPDLVVLLDGNNFDRASRHNGDAARSLIHELDIRTIIIDHHELAGKDASDVFINRHDPASTQTVYEILFNDLNLQAPKGAIDTAMAGYFADTGGFVYLKDGEQGSIFGFVEELVQKGANIEQTWNLLQQFSKDDLSVISELANNVALEQDYTYSYLSDEFINNWLINHSQAELQRGTGEFLNTYIRNIEGRKWGFIAYRNTLQGDNIYSISLRSVNGVKDVASIANSLNGGGHKAAAGAKEKASNVQEAIDKVKAAIASEA